MTHPAETSRTLVMERVFPHPPEKVWRALTETPLLDEWLMKSDFQPTAGHRFHFRAEPNPHWDGIVDCEVLTANPFTELAYRWDALGLKSTVTWRLAPTDGGTSLRMEQAGFGPEQTFAYAGAKAGWGRMLDALAGVVDRA